MYINVPAAGRKRAEFLCNTGFFIAGMLMANERFYMEKLLLKYFSWKKISLDRML